MRRLSLAAAWALLALAGCATTGTVRLDADKAFLTAQIGFESLQQAALAGIQSGAISGDAKARVIALNDKGVRLEAEGYAARQAANAAAEGDAAIGLTTIVSQIVALGVLK